MKKTTTKTINEIYEEYKRLKNLGKFDRDICIALGISKQTLEKVLNYYKEKI